MYADSPYRQSFVYYGVGSPCGYLRPGDDKIMTPDYTPPLYILPDLDIDGHYRWWSLQLLSLTLLEPLNAFPNHATLEPTDWMQRRIPIGEAIDGTLLGTRVMFDSGERRFACCTS